MSYTHTKTGKQISTPASHEEVELKGFFGSGFKYAGKHPFRTTFCVLGGGALICVGAKCVSDLFSRKNKKKDKKDDAALYDAKAKSDAVKYAEAKEAEAQKHTVCVEADTQKYCSDRTADAASYAQKREADAALYKAKCEADVAKHKAMHHQDVEEAFDDNQLEHQLPWIEDFHQKYKMPQVPDPILASILLNFPPGYKDAALCSLTSMFGALCFSKARARYLDGELHAPNLQVCVEADWGAGKGKINSIYKEVFSEVITADAQKLLSGVSGIIQNLGTGISSARLIDILASNKGVHAFMLEQEVRALTDCLKKPSGLTYEHLRKAFDNYPISRYNKQKKAVQGQFPIYLNYVLTGTPGDMNRFIGKEIEGGTASRICWTVLPQAQKEIPSLKPLTESELKYIHERIREWRKMYCYDGESGAETIAKETIVDLDYINAGLKVWLDSQWDESEEGQARISARARIAATAFHHAIVFHLFNDCPDDTQPEVRQKILDLTIYVADLLMERFLHKFGQEQNLLKRQSKRAECVRKPQQPKKRGKPTPALVNEWRTLHAQVGDNGQNIYGWDTLVKLYPGYSRNTIRRYVEGKGAYAQA